MRDTSRGIIDVAVDRTRHRDTDLHAPGEPARVPSHLGEVHLPDGRGGERFLAERHERVAPADAEVFLHRGVELRGEHHVRAHRRARGQREGDGGLVLNGSSGRGFSAAPRGHSTPRGARRSPRSRTRSRRRSEARARPSPTPSRRGDRAPRNARRRTRRRCPRRGRRRVGRSREPARGERRDGDVAARRCLRRGWGRGLWGLRGRGVGSGDSGTGMTVPRRRATARRRRWASATTRRGRRDGGGARQGGVARRDGFGGCVHDRVRRLRRGRRGRARAAPPLSTISATARIRSPAATAGRRAAQRHAERAAYDARGADARSEYIANHLAPARVTAATRWPARNSTPTRKLPSFPTILGGGRSDVTKCPSLLYNCAPPRPSYGRSCDTAFGLPHVLRGEMIEEEGEGR